ncbi:phosphoenolpyruvate synthase, partial [Klebsiella pneumoniae]|nr:phosphoenolpyruvate synthase [Klebsiella pneumoniae]
GSKEKKLVYATEGDNPTREEGVSDEYRRKFVLSDDLILKLAKWGMMIEEHYQKPMDIEWAFDGESQKLYIVQARPETVQARKDA